jgi:hypothetical protein
MGLLYLLHYLGTLTSWNPLGHPRPVTGLLYLLHYLGTLTSWNPLGHPRPVTGLFYLLHYLGTLTSWNPLGHPRPVTGLFYLLHYLGTLTSWNPLGHPRPVTGLLYLLFYSLIVLLQLLYNKKYLLQCSILLWEIFSPNSTLKYQLPFLSKTEPPIKNIKNFISTYCI